MLGRTFAPEENDPGKNDVVIVGHGLWQRRFGSDSGVVGRKIALNGRCSTIIGVMPKDFQFPLPLFNVVGGEFVGQAELWAPVTFNQSQLKVRGSRSYGVIARLKSEVSQGQHGRADILTSFERQYPDAYPEYRVRCDLFTAEQASGGFIDSVPVAGIVSFVLLIACVASKSISGSFLSQTKKTDRAALGAAPAN
jgi:hypothetical protein